MTWTWRIEGTGAEPNDASVLDSPEFSSQSDAETWIGEVWRDLVAVGATRVTLLDADRVVYGPMSLEEG